MSDAPTRLWVTHLEDQVGPREAYTHAGSWPGSRTEYILATPAALAALPAKEGGKPAPRTDYENSCPDCGPICSC
jgi:hypothetical protein